jgi:hypothetical protein
MAHYDPMSVHGQGGRTKTGQENLAWEGLTVVSAWLPVGMVQTLLRLMSYHSLDLNADRLVVRVQRRGPPLGMQNDDGAG